VAGFAVGTVTLPGGLGLADNDALEGRCTCLAFDCHETNGKKRA